MTKPRLGLTRRASLLALLASPWATALAQGEHKLPAPLDLRQDLALSAARGQPLVLLVSVRGCGFCEQVRRNYLAPLAKSGPVIVREIDLRQTTTMVGAEGERYTQAALAYQLGARLGPSVYFLGPGASNLAKPLLGFNDAFYGAYLDTALTQSRARLSESRLGEVRG